MNSLVQHVEIGGTVAPTRLGHCLRLDELLGMFDRREAERLVLASVSVVVAVLVGGDELELLAEHVHVGLVDVDAEHWAAHLYRDDVKWSKT